MLAYALVSAPFFFLLIFYSRHYSLSPLLLVGVCVFFSLVFFTDVRDRCRHWAPKINFIIHEIVLRATETIKQAPLFDI